MGLKLFTFAYNTLLEQAVKETSKFFLPKVLAGMTRSGGEHYLPITASKWGVSGLPTNLSSAFAITWFGPYFQNMLKLSEAQPDPPRITEKMISDAKKLVKTITTERLKVISCPNIGPNLNVESVEIQGLSNIKPRGGAPTPVISNNGYEFEITLDFNAYTGLPSSVDPLKPTLALGGSKQGTDTTTQESFLGLGFKISQCLCFSKDGTTCIPLPEGVEEPQDPAYTKGFLDTATGEAVINITNAKMVANASISVAPSGKTLAVTINKLSMQAESGELPTYTLAQIGIDYTEETKAYVGPWAKFVTNAFQSGEAATTLTTKVNDALKSPDNLGKVEEALNTQLNKALDEILGTPSAGFVSMGKSTNDDANKVDQFIFDRTTDSLNYTSSDLYLPKVVLGVDSPVLEPFTKSEIDVSGSFSTSFAGAKLTISSIKLPNLTLTGLANVTAPKGSVKFTGEDADATFQLGRITDSPVYHGKKVPPPPMVVKAKFSMMAQVGNNNPVGPLTGDITVDVAPKSDPTTPAVNTILGSSGPTPATLVLTFTKIALDIAPDEVNVKIVLSGAGVIYSEPVTEIANQGPLKTQIISAINKAIGGELKQISAYATKFAKQQINNLT